MPESSHDIWIMETSLPYISEVSEASDVLAGLT
jgi:hypothetical protein